MSTSGSIHSYRSFYRERILRKPATFGALLLKSVYSSPISASGILSLVLGVAAFYGTSADTLVPLRYVFPFGIMALFGLMWLSYAAWMAFNDISLTSPKLLRWTRGISAEYGSLLFEPSPFFSVDSQVSLYHIENEFEVLMAVGFVRIIQEDGKIQVQVVRVQQYMKETWTAITNNDGNTLVRVKIKPTVPAFAAED